MNINEAMGICHANGIKIWGTNQSKRMFVEVEETVGNKQPKKTSSKVVHTKYAALNEAVINTYIYYAMQIKEKLAKEPKDCKKKES